MAGPQFSLLSTDLDNGFSGNIDDILAASLSNTASSLAGTTSIHNSSSGEVVMPDLGNSRSSTDAFESCSNSHCSGRQGDVLAPVDEIAEEEARAEALSIEAEQQLVELKVKMVLLERTKHQQAQSAKHLSSLKAKCALEAGGGPENWGISIEQLRDFTDSISEDLRQYCVDHRCASGSFAHVCMNKSCNHDHGCAQYRARRQGEDVTRLGVLEPNMHTVVSVFIKPMTQDNQGVRGLALKLNEKHPKKVETFISHSWSGRFEDFVATLCSNLLPQTVVFICSFALPQNLDVGPILDAKLENTPFAQAHDIASEVFLVIDKSIDVIERVWVIYELYLSHRRNKPIQIGFSERDADFRRKIMDKIETIDVRSAKASKDADARAIKAAIAGLEDNLNDEICTKLAKKVHQYEHFLHELP